MSDTKPAAIPKEIEALIAIAESGSASIRRVITVAYQTGRLDGMLDYAKAGQPAAHVSEVAA